MLSLHALQVQLKANKLGLHRAHTLRTLYLCFIYIVYPLIWHLSCMEKLQYYISTQVVHMSRKLMACSTSGHGQWVWLRQPAICHSCGQCQAIRSTQKQVFTNLDLFIMVTSCSHAQMSKSGDFSADDRQQASNRQTDCFTPCTCKRGNKQYHALKLIQGWLDTIYSLAVVPSPVPVYDFLLQLVYTLACV